MKPSKHFVERMIERCISAKMINDVIKTHKQKPGNSKHEVKLIGSKITIVLSDQGVLVTCYFNYELGAY